jgi:uncharacterized membrane protein
MLKYLIEVTRNTLPLAILFPVFYAVALRIWGSGNPPQPDRADKMKRWIRRGVFCGVAAALVLAVLRLTTRWVTREYYDLWVLLPTLGAEALLLLDLAAVGLLPRSRIARILSLGLAFCLSALWFAYSIPNLFLFPFEFSAASDTTLNTDFMYKGIGYLLALGLIVLTAVMAGEVFRGLPRGWSLFLMVLSILGIGSRQMLSILQILLGRNLIPRPSWLMAIVMPLLDKENVFLYFPMAFVAFGAFLLVLYSKRAPIEGDNPAKVRKIKAHLKSQVRYSAVLSCGLLLALLSVTVGEALNNRTIELSPPLPMPVTDGRILIPLEQVDDRRLHRFVHKAPDGIDVRYIVIRKSDVAYGVGLDACDICGPSGYYDRGGQVICILCDVVMNISTIGFSGGCNPVPLKYSIERGFLVIEAADLEVESRRFR